MLSLGMSLISLVKFLSLSRNKFNLCLLGAGSLKKYGSGHAVKIALLLGHRSWRGFSCCWYHCSDFCWLWGGGGVRAIPIFISAPIIEWLCWCFIWCCIVFVLECTYWTVVGWISNTVFQVLMLWLIWGLYWRDAAQPVFWCWWNGGWGLGALCYFRNWCVSFPWFAKSLSTLGGCN